MSPSSGRTYAASWDGEDWIPHQRPEGNLREEMFGCFRETFRSKTQKEWLKVLKESDVQFGPVNRTVKAVANDPHNRARETVLEVTNPVTGEKAYEPGFALKFSKTPATLRYGPTKIGAETEEILKELGYSETEISKLRSLGVIR